MDKIDVITELIQNVGLVTVILIASGYFIWYMYNKGREDIKEQRTLYQELLSNEQEKHGQEMTNVVEAINNNTIVITKLTEIIRKDEENG